MSGTTYEELSELTGQPKQLLWNLISRNRERWEPTYDGRTALFSDEAVREIVEFYSLAGDKRYLSLDEVLEQYPELSLAKLRYNRRRYGMPPVKFGRNFDRTRSRPVMYFHQDDVDAFLMWDANGRPSVVRRDVFGEADEVHRVLFSDGTLVVMQKELDRPWYVDVDMEGEENPGLHLMYERLALMDAGLPSDVEYRTPAPA